MRKLIAIVDNKANDLLGVPWLYRHEAQALRQYGDLALDTTTQISKHPEDFDVILLATIDDDTLNLTPCKETLMTGVQWKAMHTAKENTKGNKLP